MSTAESAATGGEAARGPAPSPARGVRVDVPQTEHEQAAKTALQLLAYEAVRMLEAPVFVAPEAWQQQVRLMSHATAAYFAALSAPSVQTGEQP